MPKKFKERVDAVPPQAGRHSKSGSQTPQGRAGRAGRGMLTCEEKVVMLMKQSTV
jgi:hypothetical protein